VLNSLASGQVACLSSGDYAGNFKVLNSGVTLTAVPGASATIYGYIEIADSANHVTISNLTIDGSSSPQNSLQVWGDQFKLINSNINGGHSGWGESCIYLGNVTYGLAYDAVIDHNRIHDCGTSDHAHGFYMDAVRGTTKITNNYVYDNSGFGMQLYKDADNVDIEHNVFDGNQSKAGIIFSGETSSACGGAGDCASDNNTVRYNIFTNNATYGIDAWWGGTVGTGNVADHNCLYGSSSGPFGNSSGWTNGGSNVLADPLYVDRAGKDFSLRAASPCAGDGPR